MSKKVDFTKTGLAVNKETLLNLSVVIPSKSDNLCTKCGGYKSSVIHQIKCLKVKHIS